MFGYGRSGELRQVRYRDRHGRWGQAGKARSGFGARNRKGGKAG